MTNIPFARAWGDRIKEFAADFLLNNHLEQVYLGLKRLEYALAINTRGAIARRMEGSTDVASSSYRILKPLAESTSKSVLFVTYHPQGFISEHVKRYIAHFKLAGCSVILVKIVDEMNHAFTDTITDEIDAAMVRKNGGYDFGAWAHALKLFPEVYRGNSLYIVNDSVFGPLSTPSFLTLMEQIENTDADLIGLTQCYQNLHHYQSYFLVFRNLKQNRKIVKDYWDKVRNLKSKQDVIFEYEHGLKRHFSDLGLKCDAIFPILKGFSNPTIGGWKKLLDLGYPFVKVSLFRRQGGLKDKYKCREMIAKTGYDMSLIDQHIEALEKASLSPK
jgi:O-antigen biosynthesis protein